MNRKGGGKVRVSEDICLSQVLEGRMLQLFAAFFFFWNLLFFSPTSPMSILCDSTQKRWFWVCVWKAGTRHTTGFLLSVERDWTSFLWRRVKQTNESAFPRPLLFNAHRPLRVLPSVWLGVGLCVGDWKRKWFWLAKRCSSLIRRSFCLTHFSGEGRKYMQCVSPLKCAPYSVCVFVLCVC